MMDEYDSLTEKMLEFACSEKEQKVFLKKCSLSEGGDWIKCVTRRRVVHLSSKQINDLRRNILHSRIDFSVCKGCGEDTYFDVRTEERNRTGLCAKCFLLKKKRERELRRVEEDFRRSRRACL